MFYQMNSKGEITTCGDDDSDKEKEDERTIIFEFLL